MKLNERQWQIVGHLGKLLIDLIALTIRIDIVGIGKVGDILRSRRFIIAFWHGRILLTSYQFKKYEGLALVSASDDGEIIARISERQGHRTIRGSSTRGGLRALAQMIKRLKSDPRPAAMVPDGPLGPRFQVQPGVITLAQKTGLPILPVTFSGRRLKIFNSWDRFTLPLPFTTCRFLYGNPLRVPKNADRLRLEACRRQLEMELNRITIVADRYFGHCIT